VYCTKKNLTSLIRDGTLKISMVPPHRSADVAESVTTVTTVTASRRAAPDEASPRDDGVSVDVVVVLPHHVSVEGSTAGTCPASAARHSRDRFYKTPFSPKKFGQKCNSYKFHPTVTYLIYLSVWIGHISWLKCL
jgi:hypothetical protein